MYNVATLKGLKCPYCGSEKLTVKGTKGALGAAIATGAAFGAIGNLVTGSSAAKNMATEPLQYQCTDCNKKFQTFPLMAPMQDVLPAPCNITFTRMKSFVGAIVPQIVYLNGIKLGVVKNGKSITFPTANRYNTIFVTDQYGVAFKSVFSFEAQPGGSLSVRFKRKFKGSQSIPANVTYKAAEIPAGIPTSIPAAIPPQPPINAPVVESIAQPSMNTPAAESIAKPQVLFCVNCGSKLEAGDKFCSRCGAKRFSPQ